MFGNMFGWLIKKKLIELREILKVFFLKLGEYLTNYVLKLSSIRVFKIAFKESY